MKLHHAPDLGSKKQPLTPQIHLTPCSFYFQISVPTGSTYRGPEKAVENQSQKEWPVTWVPRNKTPFSFPSNYYHDSGISKYLDVSIPLFTLSGAMLICIPHTVLLTSLTVWSVGLANILRLQFHWRYSNLPLNICVLSPYPTSFKFSLKLSHFFLPSSCLVFSPFLRLQIKSSYGEVTSTY